MIVNQVAYIHGFKSSNHRLHVFIYITRHVGIDHHSRRSDDCTIADIIDAENGVQGLAFRHSISIRPTN